MPSFVKPGELVLNRSAFVRQIAREMYGTEFPDKPDYDELRDKCAERGVPLDRNTVYTAIYNGGISAAAHEERRVRRAEEERRQAREQAETERQAASDREANSRQAAGQQADLLIRLSELIQAFGGVGRLKSLLQAFGQ